MAGGIKVQGNKVSVIIPVYNAKKYLRECLDSVLNQTHKNVEIIAVNDGSTDNSLQILMEYQKQKNIKVISQTNGGVCAARNKGIEFATGNFIMFLDSDDFIYPKAIELLLSDILTYNANVSAGGMKTTNKTENQSYDEDITVYDKQESLIQALIDAPISYSACAKLFSVDIIKDVRFEVGRKIHEDSFFVFECFLKNPVVTYRKDAIYYYRPNNYSASHAEFSDKFFDILYFAEKKKKIIEEQYPEYLNKAKNLLVKANIALLQCLLKTKGKKYRKDIKKCIRFVKDNKQYFIPSYPGDRKRFKIIIYNMYWIYKFLYQLKYNKRHKT